MYIKKNIRRKNWMSGSLDLYQY